MTGSRATPSLERLHGMAEELLASWEARGERPSITIDGTRGRPLGEYPVVHGLVAHCHRAARGAVQLFRAGLVLEAIPLVRTTYECAITAQWLMQVPGAFAAVSQRALKSHDAALRTIASAGLHQNGEASTPHPHTTAVIRSMETSAAGGANSFEQLCLDLHPVGHQGYALYRVMSSLSHATIVCADRYLDLEDPAESPGLLLTPRQPDVESWLGILVCSLIWAGRATDLRDKSRARRSELRQLAREVGTTDVLRLSERAQLRQQQADRQKRLDRRQAVQPSQ